MLSSLARSIPAFWTLVQGGPVGVIETRAPRAFFIDNGEGVCYNATLVEGLTLAPARSKAARAVRALAGRWRHCAGGWRGVFEKGKMMKSIWPVKVALAVVLGAFVLLGFGCAWDQLGETTAEGRRRHKRVARINRQELLSDIDRALLLDKPSKLTDKRIP
jgi:hypothetical protein